MVLDVDHDGGLEGAEDGLGRPLDGLEADVAGEAVGDDDVHEPVHDVAALDVAVEVRDALVGGDELVRLDHLGRALGGLLADAEQADRRLGDAHDLARERLAHDGELAQELGAAPRRWRRRRGRRPARAWPA